MNPAGSIRLDLVEVTFFRDPENRVGFTLQGKKKEKCVCVCVCVCVFFLNVQKGGRKHNPRTFVTENQPECDRWVAEIRAVRVCKENCSLFFFKKKNLKKRLLTKSASVYKVS